MRKRLIRSIPQDAPHLDENWLDLDRIAVVEIQSALVITANTLRNRSDEALAHMQPVLPLFLHAKAPYGFVRSNGTRGSGGQPWPACSLEIVRRVQD
jgi:hypothetical protein